MFGEMDADGFYFSQLVTGERGLVPSNFVEKVAEGDGGEERGEREEREGGKGDKGDRERGGGEKSVEEGGEGGRQEREQ